MTDASDTEPLVSMSFDETPIADVVKAFRDATGANIISGGDSNLQARISVRLDNVPWRKGLTSILEPQGLQLAEEPAGSGIYIVRAKTDVIPKITKTFDLKHARADEITNLVVSAFGRDATGKPRSPPFLQCRQHHRHRNRSRSRVRAIEATDKRRRKSTLRSVLN